MHKPPFTLNVSWLRDFTFVAFTFLGLAPISLAAIDVYYYYIFVLLLFPIMVYRFRVIDSKLIWIFSYVFIIGIFNVLLENNELFQLLKVFISTFIAFWLFYLILKDKGFDFKYYFRIYYKYSFVMACLGLFQFFSFLVKFSYGYDLRWLGIRELSGNDKFYPIHALFTEPAAFGVVLAPAAYLALSNLFSLKTPVRFGKKYQAVIILCAYLLTQSSTAYISLLIAVALLNLQRINFTRLLVAIVCLPTIIIILYTVSPKFQARLDTSVSLVTGQILLDAAKVSDNGSSLILFNHFTIALKNALDHPLGTGFGSHHAAFFRYNTVQMYFTGYGPYSMILNLHDGSSLFNRILSEMGFVGLFFTFAFMKRYFVRDGSIDMIVMNHACLVFILTCLLRGGSYFTFGLPFFIYCYYYTSKFSKTINQAQQT